jgi:mannitol/fructose-specific phosphotransferase system IIA component (Ntr-type)
MTDNSASPLRLAGLLTPTTVLLDFPAAGRDDALAALANKAAVALGRPEAAEALAKVLIEREHMHSTGIGDGVALPHSRNIQADLATRPLIVFGRHSAGLPFNAIDHQPVRLFFLLIATNLSQHLFILARLSRLLRQKPVRQLLLEAGSAEKILECIREAEANMP